MDREERIRARAHSIWEKEGRPIGRQQEHWQRACGEIDADTRLSGTPEDGAHRPAATSANAGSRNDVVGSSGLVGADDVGVGTPDVMAVDDLKVAGSLNDPKGDHPSTGRSKLVGT